MEMVTRRKEERTRKLPSFVLNETALSDRKGFDWQRVFAAGMLIFSLALGVLIVQAGWKEILAHEECSLSGVSDCQPSAGETSD